MRAYSDSAALAWDTKFTGIKDTMSRFFLKYNGDDVTSLSSAKNSMYGYEAKYNMSLFQYRRSIGGVSSEVVAHKSDNGRVGSFQAAYVHSLAPFGGGVSIGPASINIPLSWLSEEFILDFNFIIR